MTRPGRAGPHIDRGSSVNLPALNNDQVHAVAAHLAVAEAIMRTRLPADVKPEARRYRLR